MTHGYRYDGNENQRYKDENPQMPLRLELVAGKQLKHQQYEMKSECDKHCLVVDVSIAF